MGLPAPGQRMAVVDEQGETVDGDQRQLNFNPDLSPGPHVLLTVSDTGTGITSDIIEKVFDPFYQGSAKPRGPVKGTGLGLAIVREYVLAHRGDVQILEDQPAGAHFRVSLPMLQGLAA